MWILCKESLFVHMLFYSILSLIHALACCYFLVIHSKTYCLFCAYQVTHLFDNGGTVFFAIFMAIWGESESFYFNHCSFHQQKDRQVSMWFKNKLSNIKKRLPSAWRIRIYSSLWSAIGMTKSPREAAVINYRFVQHYNKLFNHVTVDLT